MRAKTGQRGFTLVELMIGVAIVGILAAVAAPGIMSSMFRYRLRAEVRELVINFKKARLEAVKRNQNVAISFAPGVGINPGGYSYPGPNTGVTLIQEIRPELQLTNVAFGPAPGNTVTYMPNGMVTSMGRCEIWTLDGINRYALVLSITGAVRVESSSNGGVTWSE